MIMKYKIGDKVKIKTWESMEKEYGLYSDNNEMIDCDVGFSWRRENFIKRKFPDRILTIDKRCKNNTYFMNIRNSIWISNWSDNSIEYSLQELEEKTYIPISSRFELLDIR